MAAGIAEPASGHDVSSAPPTLLAFHEVLSRALECSDLSEAKSVAHGERIRVAQPHRLKAIIALAILEIKSTRAC